jgi:ABC-type multidrug transport system fused ATPase/permease subunit
MKKELYRNNKFNFFVLLITALTDTAIMILISLMLEKILSVAISKDLNSLYKNGFSFLIYLFIAIIIYTCNIIVKPIYQKRAITQYKNKIYNKILSKSIDNFNNYETSIYISSLTNDVKYIEENYIFSIFPIITQVTLFLTTLVVMLVYSPILTLVSILFAILPLVASLIVGGKLSYYEEKISEENGSFMHFVKDNLVGFSTIKVFQSENKIGELFHKNNGKLENINAKKTKVTAIMEFLQGVTSIVAQFGVFFVGAYLCIKKESFSSSVLLLFVQLMNYIISPIATIPMYISKRNAAKPLFERIENIINDESIEEKNAVKFNNTISISNLNFAYDDKQVLKDINLLINKNKSYAIVGTSGSGKTTLLNLICGRNKNYNGTIMYDDIELKNISLSSLYENLTFVEQNVFVFDDTLYNNITMYSKVEDELFNEAVKKAGLTTLINEKGIDYKCGENGCNLSGGEKQRVSIARALIKKSNIILMDEATSALDTDTACNVMQNIIDLENMTKLVITHNLDKNILKQFDEILVVSDGYIIEKDSFEKLIEKQGMFYSLYNYSNKQN